MDKWPSLSRPLQLEMLEGRTLLAGGWEADYAVVNPAVSGNGDFTLAFNPRIGISELVITGGPDSSLIINFDILPSFVTSVVISQFESVNFTGIDTLTKLVATDIKTLNAPGISLDFGVYSNNVGDITLASGGTLALLTGTSTKLEIAKLDGTLIISDLQNLTIDSTSSSLAVVSLNSTQMVKVLYAPEQISVAGLTDSQNQVLFLPNGEASTPSTPEPGVVVTIIPSEETNILLARLRDLIRTPTTGNENQAFTLVSQHGWQEIQNKIQPGSGRDTVSPRLLEAGQEITVTTTEAGPTDYVSDPTYFQTLGDMELSNLAKSPDHVEFVDTEMLSGNWWVEAHTTNGTDGTFDVVFLPDAESESSEQSAAMDGGTFQNWMLDSLNADPVTLKDEIMERIAAELTPGEQTAYLLVDPKPARAGLTKNRESALDSFD